jgi:hypothetical protein
MIYALRFTVFAMMLFIATVVFSQTPAQGDSLPEKTPELPKTVLIVKSNSYMENEVSRILCDSLSVKGFSIKTVSPESIKKERAGSYRASIIFNAIHSSKISRVVRSYARALSAERSNILIFTVTGESWKDGESKVDAVAGATKTLNPVEVSGKILGYFNRIIETK